MAFICPETQQYLRGTIISLVFFLVYVVEENTSLGVGMDGFFCKVRGYTASLVFPDSVAVVVCDAAFRSNH